MRTIRLLVAAAALALAFGVASDTAGATDGLSQAVQKVREASTVVAVLPIDQFSLN